MDNSSSKEVSVKTLEKGFLRKLLPTLKNKYFIALLVFVAWLIFFDKNDLLTQIQRKQELNDLQTSKQQFSNEITAIRKELDQLITNPEVLEKYARERYLMKKENEDLFVIYMENQKKGN